MKKLRDAEVFDHVVLNFAAKTGTRVTIAKDFPPEIEKLEARLRQCGAHYDSEVVRDPENGKFVEKRFDLSPTSRAASACCPTTTPAASPSTSPTSTASRR